MPEKRYVLCPGHVISKSDGQEHYITAAQLAHLYGVKLEECLVQNPGDRMDGFSKEQQAKLKWLRPRYHGDYHKMPTMVRAKIDLKLAGGRIKFDGELTEKAAAAIALELTADVGMVPIVQSPPEG